MPPQPEHASPEKVKIRCGYCNGIMKQADVNINHKTSCTVCGTNHQIKPKCAYQLVAKATGAPSNLFQQIDNDTFQQTNTNLMCELCREKCFYCSKDHKSNSKYYIWYISWKFVNYVI